MVDFEKMRSNMVKRQLLPNKVTNNRLVRAFTEIPRELFITEPDQGLAYSDTILKIVPERSLLKPMVLGKLLQAAELEPFFKVLDVAPSTGYGAALLSYSVRSIIAVEEDETLFEKLTKNIETLNIPSVIPTQRSLRRGVTEEAPYDVILIEGTVEEVPQDLFGQLKEGGKLLTIEGKSPQEPTQAVCYHKIGSYITKHFLFECEAQPLPSFNKAYQDFRI
jgi:protein-L-isoaspartate(D-aspartate) O-methyltransferase